MVRVLDYRSPIPDSILALGPPHSVVCITVQIKYNTLGLVGHKSFAFSPLTLIRGACQPLPKEGLVVF